MNGPSAWMRIRGVIETLDSSITLEQFIFKCDLEGWETAVSTTGLSAYSWSLGDDYFLQACFAEGPGLITNRFGPCCISRQGELVWKLLPQSEIWQTQLATMLADLARECQSSRSESED